MVKKTILLNNKVYFKSKNKILDNKETGDQHLMDKLQVFCIILEESGETWRQVQFIKFLCL